MPEQESTPFTFEHYDMERLLRKDVFGEVWRALDRESGIKVDLRLLPEWADLTATEAFVKQILPLSHSALVPTKGYVSEGEKSAVVLDSIEGDTIPARRSRRPRRHFEISEIKPWLRTMVDVVGYLHNRGIAHGALQLSSFVIEGGSLYVNDLPISRLMRPQDCFQGGALLPLSVMSPQVMKGAAPKPADDIYALAAIVYDLLTSTPVFMSGDIALQVESAIPQTIQERRAQQEIASAPIPTEWQNWLSQALSKEEGKRPGLESLSALLKAGVPFMSGTSTSTSIPITSSTLQTSYSESAPATTTPATLPILPRKLNINHYIIGGVVSICLLLGVLVYFLKVAPRNDFKRKMDAEFAQVNEFDLQEHADHQAVIDRWDAFEKKWKNDVESNYPMFISVVNTAHERKDERERQNEKEQQQAQEDADERRRAYVLKAKAEFDSVSASAAVQMDRKPEEALQLWEKYLAEYDKEFEGNKLVELEESLSKGRAFRQQLKDSLAKDAKQIADFITSTEDALVQLKLQLGDAGLAAAYKITLIETFIARFTTAPRTVMTDSKVLEMKTQVENLLPELTLRAGTETPVEPLDLVKLFPELPVSAFSENGKKNILKEAQTILKELNFYTGTPDGSTGKGTHEALIAYQKSKNLVPSAALDTRTITELGMLDLQDNTTTLAGAGNSTTRRSSGSRKKKVEEEKSFMGKVGDTTKKVTKSIGGFFSGDKKD